MQIIADNTRTGELVVQVDTLDDLWVLYNIIKPDDRVRGTDIATGCFTGRRCR